MKKKIIGIIIIIILLVLLGSFFYFRKNTKDDSNNNINVKLTTNLDINLFKLVSSYEKDNYLISPYSIKMALNMLREGANNNSLKEIDNVLNKKTILLNNENVKIANALFLRDIYENYTQKEFVNSLKKNYDAEVLIDRYDSPKVINDWVRKNTDGMIDKILDNIDKDFVLGLANAIAIDVKWENEFDCTNTYKEEFTNKQNKKINVEMMHQTFKSSSTYLENDNVKGIVLPYKDDTGLEFIGLLPNQNIDDYISNNLESDLSNLDNQIKKDVKNIALSIPRFKFSYSLDNFKDILIKLGIKEVFNPSFADLTRMIDRSNFEKAGIVNLYVDEAIHKTYIDFNEKGTKAAAITYFGVKNYSMIKEEEPLKLIFNKPFISIIRDKETKEILFIGVVNSPTKWTKETCQK